MPVTYENILYDFCLDPLRDLFIAEYNYGKIYIAPTIQHHDPFSIRIWCNSAESIRYVASAWQKQYNIEVALYEIEKNPGEQYYKQFFNDIERIYQLLFDNAKSVSTTVSKSGNTTGSVTRVLLDGVCEDFTINEFDEEEEAIDGLNVCKFTFNCKILREDS